MPQYPKKLNILVTNDDGITAGNLAILARAAKQFGNVTVVAPAGQCTAMSRKLTICKDMEVRRADDFPMEGVEAWSLDGTPVDCVKAAYYCLMKEKPDLILSGINYGYNAGLDCAYSGTAGAAFEGTMLGIPAIAVSHDVPQGSLFDGNGSEYAVVNEYLVPIIRELIDTELEPWCFWNVNIPGCSLNELKGIKRGVKPAKLHPYMDNLVMKSEPDGKTTIGVWDYMVKIENTEEGTDINALLNNYISIGKITESMLMG